MGASFELSSHQRQCRRSRVEPVTQNVINLINSGLLPERAKRWIGKAQELIAYMRQYYGDDVFGLAWDIHHDETDHHVMWPQGRQSDPDWFYIEQVVLWLTA